MRVGDPVRITIALGRRKIRGVILAELLDGRLRVSTDKYPIEVSRDQVEVIRKRDERVAVLSRRAALDRLSEGLARHPRRARA